MCFHASSFISTWSWSSTRVTIMFLVTSLDKPLLHQLLWAGRPALGRVLVVPNIFHLRIMEATVLLGIFSAAEMFCSLPQICAAIQSCLWALLAVPLNSWLGFHSDMHLWAGRPFIERCVLFQFNLSQVDSNQGVETSRQWSREIGDTGATFQVLLQRVWNLM